MQLITAVMICLIILPCLCSAEDIYVTGVTNITMRTGPGTDHRVLEMLKSGTKLEIVEFQQDWTQVKTLQGRTGWVLSRFLTQKVPDALIVKKLETQNQALTKKLETLEAEHRNITVKNAALVQIEEKYQKLKSESAQFLELDSRYRAKVKEAEEQKARIQELEQRLGSEVKMWYLIGPGVLIVGFIFGLSTRKKKKSSLL